MSRRRRFPCKSGASTSRYLATNDGNMITDGFGNPILINGLSQIKTTVHYLTDNKGNLRYYIKEVPAKQNLGVLLNYHGGYGTAASVRDSFGWDYDLKKLFINIYVDSAQSGVITPINGNSKAHNSRGDFDPSNLEPDDVAFAQAVLAEVDAAHDIDVNNINFIGISNGGMFGHLLASESQRLNLAYKMKQYIALSAVITQNTGVEPYVFTGKAHRVNGLFDTTVPQAGFVGSPISYMTWAASDAIIDATASGSSERLVINSEHSVDAILDGLKNNIPAYASLQELVLELLA